MTRPRKFFVCFWLLTALPVLAVSCAGPRAVTNEPTKADLSRFHGIVQRFQTCCENEILDLAESSASSEQVVCIAMIRCADIIKPLESVMIASGCCSPQYIEGFVRGSWSSTRRKLLEFVNQSE